jgi:hypothetical protein
VEQGRLLIGWREWISLPKLKIPVMKAKVDTGAKTSSLHAFRIETYTERGIAMVRFHVHPVQRREDLVVVCHAPIIDYRVVSDSGGHRESRYVIETGLSIGGLSWPIEVTLANRETMNFRFLLGRSAMTHFLLDPSKSFLLGAPEKRLAKYFASKGHKPSAAPKPAAAVRTPTRKRKRA